ncbi:MAG: hypothetical protein LBE12_12290 [Planctomycetaceae bacterium]|nr:hypothetical protein [Planctomycetaceae bacterium]
MRHSPLSTLNYSLALAGLWENGGVPDPAVALRLTAGYAVHTPSGVKSKKQKFHGYITKNKNSAKIFMKKLLSVLAICFACVKINEICNYSAI